METEKYLKFMPQSIELAAQVSTRLALLADSSADHTNQKTASQRPQRADEDKSFNLTNRLSQLRHNGVPQVQNVWTVHKQTH